ncbi:hypothetical protein [Gordonia zhenghanii]|nr:hypothetical protein [Gordonia zhenghanii]
MATPNKNHQAGRGQQQHHSTPQRRRRVRQWDRRSRRWTWIWR